MRMLPVRFQNWILIFYVGENLFGPSALIVQITGNSVDQLRTWIAKVCQQAGVC
jgi:hypothetical protein